MQKMDVMDAVVLTILGVPAMVLEYMIYTEVSALGKTLMTAALILSIALIATLYLIDDQRCVKGVLVCVLLITIAILLFPVACELIIG